MDLAIVDYAARPPVRAAALRSSGNELVFGDTSVFLGSPAPSDGDVRARRNAALAFDERPYLVTQKGRLFQRAYPDINVIVDKGRYLLVSLSPARAAQIQTSDEPCFKIEPVTGGRVVYQRMASAPASAAMVTRRAALPPLSESVFSDALAALTGLPTRHSTSLGYLDAIELCRMRLTTAGCTVAVEPVPLPGGTTRNLIARATNAQGPPRVIVTAHLDSVNHDAGPDAPAPGADDNGSGSAGVIALADALLAGDVAGDVLFALFGGEEQGLFGSRAFVDAGRHFDRGAVAAVINMDMIGSINPPDDPNAARLAVLIEGAEISRRLVDALSAAAAAHTRLAVTTSLQPFASDHLPFIEAAMPAVLTIEGEDSTNRFIHGGDDTLEHIDPVLAMEILKMNLACIVGYVDEGN